MTRLTRYPDTVTLRRYPHSTASAKDERGNYIDADPDPEATEEIEARIEPATQSTLLTEAGKLIQLSNSIYCPLTEYVYTEDGNSEAEIDGTTYKIVRFKRYQTHVEIWV